MQEKRRKSVRAYLSEQERANETVSTQRAAIRQAEKAPQAALTAGWHASSLQDLLGDFSEQTGAFFG